MPLGFAQCMRFDRKLCCCCEYWNGERELEFKNGRLYAIQAQTSPQGRCLARSNVLMSYANNAESCKAYKRWHKLP